MRLEMREMSEEGRKATELLYYQAREKRGKERSASMQEEYVRIEWWRVCTTLCKDHTQRLRKCVLCVCEKIIQYGAD